MNSLRMFSVALAMSSASCLVQAAPAIPSEFHGRWAPVKDGDGVPYTAKQNKVHCSTGGHAQPNKSQGDEGSLGALKVSAKSVTYSLSESTVTFTPKAVKKQVPGYFVATSTVSAGGEWSVGSVELRRFDDKVEVASPYGTKTVYVRCK